MLDSIHATMIVSIPHRYAKNSRQAPLDAGHDQVSIPHRYAKNNLEEINHPFAEELFQFLIGTLKTPIRT